MKKRNMLLLSILILTVLAACAPATHDLTKFAGKIGEPAGFWKGLWHGCILFVTFVISLFSDSVTVYEVHNNGGWYNFGFLLGVMIVFGGSGHGSGKK